jgi:hypothetical protein
MKHKGTATVHATKLRITLSIAAILMLYLQFVVDSNSQNIQADTLLILIGHFVL